MSTLVVPRGHVPGTAIVPADVNDNFAAIEEGFDRVEEAWLRELGRFPKGVVGYAANVGDAANAASVSEPDVVSYWVSGFQATELRVAFDVEAHRRYKATLHSQIYSVGAGTYGYVGVGLYFGDQSGTGTTLPPVYDGNATPFDEVTVLARAAHEVYVAAEGQAVAVSALFSFTEDVEDVKVTVVHGFLSGPSTVTLGFGPTNSTALLLVEDMGSF